MSDIDNIFTRRDLIAAYDAGLRPEMISFWGHTGPPDAVGPFVLSQWREAVFELEGISYPTAEHYMMAEKARLFAAEDLRADIIASTDPGKAKALGRKIENFDETKWVENRFDIVVRASMAKFGQNRALRDYLLATHGKLLVEASPQDRIWGIGLSRDDPALGDPHAWQGDNLLGFALMKSRAMLAANIHA